MGITTMFTNSCVQQDLYDEFYEECDGHFVHKKNGKDINYQAIDDGINQILADNWAKNSGFAAREGECLACAMYNYSIAKQMNKSRYECRKGVGRVAYSNDWQYPYFIAVTQNGGVSLSDGEVNAIIYNVVGASNHTAQKESLKPSYFTMTKNHKEKVIVEINHHHYGVLQLVYYYSSESKWKITIKDQYGSDMGYDFDNITAVFY